MEERKIDVPGAARATGWTPQGRHDRIAQGIVDLLRDTAATRCAHHKNRAAEALGVAAQAVRLSTRHLREQHHDAVAGVVEQAASRLEAWSDLTRNKDLTELMHDLQRLARNRPALFTGGAFVLGLVGARVWTRSRDHGRRASSRHPMDGARDQHVARSAFGHVAKTSPWRVVPDAGDTRPLS